MSFDDFREPVVIDNGSATIKAGIAGLERPSHVIPTMIGEPKHTRVIISETKTEKYYGDEAIQARGLCRLNPPIKQGIVENMNDMTLLWQHINQDLIKISPQDHPFLLTERANSSSRNRISTAETFFDQFNVPAVFFAPPAVLALYASARLTGCVLDVGHGVTTCVPVCDGFALPHAITRMECAGNDVTRYFHHLLVKSGLKFHTSSEMYTVQLMKEALCEFELTPSRSKITSKASAAHHHNTYLDDESPVKYMLPDGSEINIGKAKFKAAQVLFDPSLIGLEYRGVHQCILDSVSKSDLDLRNKLYSSVIMSGGTTQMKSFGQKLVNALKEEKKQATVRVYAPSERELTSWIGGSMLASTPGFSTMWMKKSEYDEAGASVLFRKAFF